MTRKDFLLGAKAVRRIIFDNPGLTKAALEEKSPNAGYYTAYLRKVGLIAIRVDHKLNKETSFCKPRLENEGTDVSADLSETG